MVRPAFAFPVRLRIHVTRKVVTVHHVLVFEAGLVAPNDVEEQG
jgi:hypothetical protein